MQKNDKMQIGQNAKVLNINNPKYSILGVPIENQCVKGGGLLYGGFGLLIFGIFCILSVLTFCHICILSRIQAGEAKLSLAQLIQPKQLKVMCLK